MLLEKTEDIETCLTYLMKAMKLNSEFNAKAKTEKDFISKRDNDEFSKLFQLSPLDNFLTRVCR